jgi:D-aspartate ligase
MKNSLQNSKLPSAVVVGLCSHGLATVRALALSGVKVHAIESNRSLSGVATRCASVHFVDDINGPGLIDALMILRKKINTSTNPVLFLTNDRMVLKVGNNLRRIEEFYQLSWAESKDTVIKLLNKSTLEARCKEVNLNYPESWIIDNEKSVQQIVEQLHYPLIVKPVKPLSKFKVKIIRSFDDLSFLIDKYSSEFPFLIQRWIAGDDLMISFCALYLEKGNVRARFDGRKLLSYPPALGQTLIAEPAMDNQVYECTLKFFQELNLTGPVSLEVKRDSSQRIWIIEPTIGRTDWWLLACVKNEINLPYIEYCLMSNVEIETPKQNGTYRWYDTERDPLCFLRIAWSKGVIKEWQRAVFPYLDRNDLRPFFLAIYKIISLYLTRLGTYISKRFEHTRKQRSTS